MLFNSWIFATFFALFFPVYLLLRKQIYLRNLWILLASYAFYGWWSPKFVILLATLASVDYVAAMGVTGQKISNLQRAKAIALPASTALACRYFAGADASLFLASAFTILVAFVMASVLLDRAPVERRKVMWVWASAIANLGTLAYFKYANFFIDSIETAFRGIGWDVGTVTLNVVLPIGLSFHVFQGLARTVDCYKGKIKPEGSLTTVAAYLAFFPQLVAGPIERAAHLIPQFETKRPIDFQLIGSGIALFVWGLYLKIVVADNVAPIANAAFANAASIDGGTAIGGALAFTVQIYCDFYGYSCMARGLARLLGFDLMANFNQPYFSRTPSEFWSRWHISLSSWLRDYLYIPLGGNRNGISRTNRNLMLTMVLGGLWHGASWTFIVWGALHGAVLILYRTLAVDDTLDKTSFWSWRGLIIHLSSWALMMFFAVAGWILFRASTFAEASNMFLAPFRSKPYDWNGLATLCHFVLPLVLIEIAQRAFRKQEVLVVGPFFLRYTAFVFTLIVIVVFGAPSGQNFIYFDF